MATPGLGLPRSGLRIDLPPEEERVLRATARLRAQQRKGDDEYRTHPWPFLRDCVWTLDQATGQIRPITDGLVREPEPGCDCKIGGCENYLECIVNRWVAEPRFIVPKSRRMRLSWVLCACHVWLARYRPGSMIAVICRKRGKTDSEGSSELVRRFKFILEHLPPERTAPIAWTYDIGRIRFPEIDSEVVAMAQGADQLRQYTCSAVFADEVAFWERARETYNASLPTLEGGGRLTMVSSANPGFFKQLVFDEHVH